MKRNGKSKKLRLFSETIKQLQDRELQTAVGGLPDCSKFNESSCHLVNTSSFDTACG